ncbi:glutaredoxin family protein [Ferrimonas marina]|uniref:Glutaredoxin n=1 Tax=Ferrimonas marina TaxID=299255 RepID=A0A1M5XCJ2_9GAMM|nr:glutaredoxin family protein [Ferrimonas marina]SHH97496.1 Glutaredoxin [Ferrimonas marina]
MKKVLIGLAVAALLLSGMLYQLGAGNRLALELNEAYQSEVVLYSASWCTVCDRTRAYLQQQGHPFVEVDMEQDPKAAREFAQFGGHGVPFLLVKGQAMRGFQPSAIEQALQQ